MSLARIVFARVDWCDCMSSVWASFTAGQLLRREGFVQHQGPQDRSGAQVLSPRVRSERMHDRLGEQA